MFINTEFSAGQCWSEFPPRPEEPENFPEKKIGMTAVLENVPSSLVSSPPWKQQRTWKQQRRSKGHSRGPLMSSVPHLPKPGQAMAPRWWLPRRWPRSMAGRSGSTSCPTLEWLSDQVWLTWAALPVPPLLFWTLNPLHEDTKAFLASCGHDTQGSSCGFIGIGCIFLPRVSDFSLAVGSMLIKVLLTLLS